MFYYAVSYFDVVFIFELLSTLSRVCSQGYPDGCLVLFRILAQFGFTQGGQEYTPKVDPSKLNKYFYKLTTSSQPTQATHFLIANEKNKSQILIFQQSKKHFLFEKPSFFTKNVQFAVQISRMRVKSVVFVEKSVNFNENGQISFENDQFRIEFWCPSI